jgi:hypothetical protein
MSNWVAVSGSWPMARLKITTAATARAHSPAEKAPAREEWRPAAVRSAWPMDSRGSVRPSFFCFFKNAILLRPFQFQRRFWTT